MKLDSIRIVLVETTHPGNIGSTARAMKTMGLSNLYLVSPKIFPHQHAIEMAAGADDILEQAVVVDSLSDAIAPCHLVLGTSARRRDLDISLLNPHEQACMVFENAHQQQIAIVFGREHAGLTNDELLACHYHIHIPSNPEYSSLNLSQAVQIIAYEIRHVFQQNNDINHQGLVDFATQDEVERLFDHMKTVLIDVDFLKPSNPKKLMQRLRRLFNRARLEHNEVNILRGMMTQIQRSLKPGGTNRQSDKDFKHE